MSDKISVSVLDLVTLYTNVVIAARDKELGYENADQTYEQFLTKLKEQRFFVTHSDLEDILWAAKQMSDAGKFFCAKEGFTFEEFVKEAFPRHMIYYEKYGWIKE